MSKLIPSISGMACLVWIATWSWSLSSKYNEKADLADHPPIASVHIADDTFHFSSKQIFSFHPSDARPVVPQENFTLFGELADYLLKNENRQLVLTGKYQADEKNTFPYPNLGLARSNAIKDILIKEGADREQVLTMGKLVESNYLFDGRIIGGVDFGFTEKDKKQAVAEVSEKETATSGTKAGGKKKTTESKALTFTYAEKKFSLARSDKPSLDKLRRLIRKNPSYKLILSGFSDKEEERAVSGNLAERRARAVRRYLVDTGVRRKNIIVESHPGAGKGKEQRKVEITIIK
ncbi:MAG TPA: hypothetical protein ENJ95_13195 [Bacteroidetes bacterium]|nr:hypothetical protein [Bacteroidota bacterium]